MIRLLLVLLLLPGFIIAQNPVKSLFEDLDRSQMQTPLLFYDAFSFSEVANPDKTHFTTNGLIQASNELGQYDSENRFPSPGFWIKRKADSRLSAITPLSIIFTEFEVINSESYNNGDLEMINGKLKFASHVSGSVFELKKKLIAAPLQNTFKSRQLQYELTPDLFINASDSEIQSLTIDFDDGEGSRSVQAGELVSVSYSDFGIKTILFEVHLSSGEIYRSSSEIRIKDTVSALQMRNPSGTIIPFTSSITPDLSAYGEAVNYPGQGEYQIFLDTANGVLDKPVILVDGFDPGDTRDIAAMYGLLDYTDNMGPNNLADLIRAQGYDVVILNFPVYNRVADGATIDGGADFIERNALLLVDLITTINSSKTGDEQNVIIGPSMGGLITRYALNYMEQQALDHDTRLFLSIDSPHRGANVPIGLQHQLNYLAFGLGANSVTDLQPLIQDFLYSAAARQMLVDHLDSHLASGSNVEFDPSLLTPVPHPFKGIFDSDINSLTVNGFPQNVRNVAIINGSGIGNPYQDKNGSDISPGFSLINDSFTVAPSPPTTADLAINFTPATASGVQPISEILVVTTIIFPITLYDVTANAQAFSYSDGVDAGSGGLFNLSGLTDGFPATGITLDFLNALSSDYFNFIPSVSGIALEITSNGEIDWYHNIDIGNGSPPSDPIGDVINSTPFVNWYMPDNNEEHVLLTEANVIFALSEIAPEILNVSSFNNGGIRLKKNPVQDRLTILSESAMGDVNLELYDLTGRIVWSRSFGNIAEDLEVSINLSNGVYLLTIQNETGSKTAKLVVDR